MTLPALATIADLEARMGDVDDTRAQAALDDASAWIRAEARQTWTDDDGNLTEVPDIAFTICLQVARRILENPDGVQEQHLGAFGETLSNASADGYLTRSEKDQIRALRPTGGLWTQSTTRGDEDVRPVCFDVVYTDGTPGEPFPLLEPGDLT